MLGNYREVRKTFATLFGWLLESGCWKRVFEVLRWWMAGIRSLGKIWSSLIMTKDLKQVVIAEGENHADHFFEILCRHSILLVGQNGQTVIHGCLYKTLQCEGLPTRSRTRFSHWMMRSPLRSLWKVFSGATCQSNMMHACINVRCIVRWVVWTSMSIVPSPIKIGEVCPLSYSVAPGPTRSWAMIPMMFHCVLSLVASITLATRTASSTGTRTRSDQ